MKMAKADDNDMRAATTLVGLLDNVHRNDYPSRNAEEGDTDPTYFDPDDHDHLRIFYERIMALLDQAPGGLFRVVWGFHTITHPNNAIVDPNQDVLELHPRLAYADELLVALKAIIKEIDPIAHKDALSQAEAAIAKAEGRHG